MLMSIGIFKNNKLDFKGHPQRIPIAVQKMKSKDQAILEIFHVKDSSNLIDTKFCGQNTRTRLLNCLK